VKCEGDPLHADVHDHEERLHDLVGSRAMRQTDSQRRQLGGGWDHITILYTNRQQYTKGSAYNNMLSSPAVLSVCH